MTWVENAGVDNATRDDMEMRPFNATVEFSCVDGTSFMYTLNRQGDKTEPWGRPFLWSLQELHLSAMCMHVEASVSEK